MSRPFSTGVLFAVALFSAFAANALLQPRQYRASSLLGIEFPDPETRATASSEPLEAVRLLRDAVLTPDFRAELTRGITPPLDIPPAMASADGLSFVISVQHRDPKLAELACNRVAKRAAELAPKILGANFAAPPKSAALRSVEPLKELAARHPGLLQRPSEQPPEVLAQWRNVLRQVAQASSGPQPVHPPLPTARLQPAVASPTPVDSVHRDRLLLVGLIASVGIGIAFGLARKAMIPEVSSGSASHSLDGDRELPDPNSEVEASPASVRNPNEYPVSDLLKGRPLPADTDVPFAVPHGTRALPSPLPQAYPSEASSKGSVSQQTVALGSPLPPSPDEGEARPLRSPLLARDARPKSGGYSFVSSPPTAPEVPVRLTDASASFHPDSSLQPSSCASLRRELYALGIHKCFVFGITCVSDSRDAKARFAAELALLLAQPGHARILLLEADFERPRVHQLVQLELLQQENLSEQLQLDPEQVEKDGWVVLRCTRSLHLLVETAPPKTLPNLSGRFAQCVRDLRQHYDFIILDCPPSELEENPFVLPSLVDGVFIVNKHSTDAELLPLAERFADKRLVKAVRMS